MSIVDFVPAVDSLGRVSSLPLADILPVLGIPIEFRTNSVYVLDEIDEAFGAWRHLDDSPSGTTTLMVRVVVVEGDEGGVAPSHVTHLCPDAERFIAHSAGSVGVCDPARRESVAYVTTALAADREHFRVAMLEALTFALVSQFDRHPLHAAAVACDGRVALLVGESGAGKSTLAYLARSAGFDVLAEDHAWIQLEPALRVWGGVSRVRLGADAITHFPNVDPAGVITTVGGKTKLAVEVAPTSGALVAADPVVCLLSHTSGSASIESADVEEIVSALTTNVAPGFDRFPERHRRVVDALAARGGWRLRLSSNPRDALPLLERICVK